MFTVYQKNVGGRVYDRYFKDWENAKKVLQKEVSEMKKFGWLVTNIQDYFDESEAAYIYQVDGIASSGEKFTFALIDAYFED